MTDVVITAPLAGPVTPRLERLWSVAASLIGRRQ